jgi:hypothetical protein
VIQFLLRYLRPEIRVSTGSQLREGPAIVEGLAGKPEAPLLTPVRQIPCVAYGYTASRVLQLRQGMGPQAIRQVRAQGEFPLVLADGVEVLATPTKPGERVSAEEHKELAAQGFQGFQVNEQPVRVGRIVRLEGMLHRHGAGWQLRYRLLEDLSDGPELARIAAEEAARARKRAANAR